MLSHEVDDPICLRKSLMRAKGTFKCRSLLFGMACGDMNSQCLGMQELFLTGRALERKMALVRLQMVVHRILILLGGLTD